MIKLLTFPSHYGLFSASPFCVKVRHLLHFSGVEWERKDLQDPRKMPKGKLPVIALDDGTLIEDSSNIYNYLESLDIDFMPGLSEEQKAASHALIRMAEEHLLFILLLDRWGDDTTWPAFRDRVFTAIPKLMRPFVANMIRKKLLAGMNAQGIGRLNEKERLERAEHDFQALLTYLSKSKFLMGDHITLADIAILPILESMAVGEEDTILRKRIKNDARFMEYIKQANKELGL